MDLHCDEGYGFCLFDPLTVGKMRRERLEGKASVWANELPKPENVYGIMKIDLSHVRVFMKKLIIILIVLLLVWAAVGIADFFRVYSFEKPIFCIAADTADDGGSGEYRGLGYSFVIEGNFMPEDEFPGVTKYEYYLFGKLISTGIRD